MALCIPIQWIAIDPGSVCRSEHTGSSLGRHAAPAPRLPLNHSEGPRNKILLYYSDVQLKNSRDTHQDDISPLRLTVWRFVLVLPEKLIKTNAC